MPQATGHIPEMKSQIVKTLQHWITKLAERRERFSYRIQEHWMNYVNVVSGGTGCLNWARPGLWGREADQGICLSLPGANPPDVPTRALFLGKCGLARGKTHGTLAKHQERGKSHP